MNQQRLFRQEAIDSRKNNHYGVISINTPVQYTVLIVGCLMLVIGLFLFLIMADFSDKFIVKGYLESSKGVSNVYPNKSGFIEKCYIKQGDKVKKGARLFLINTSYDGSDRARLDAVLRELLKHKQSIDEELVDKAKNLETLKQLLVKKYIPMSTYNDKHDEWQALQRQKNRISVEIINFKHSKAYVIRAPIGGDISSVMVQEGQYTNRTKPLMKILPEGADLLAKLYIPVRHSGFLEATDHVIVRYDAYPYIRFGTSRAKIINISQSVLIDKEEEKPLRIGQPYYSVSASLEHQFVKVYGRNRSLQHGMTISAIIVGSKRKVWQWVLDPLYSFYGGMFS